MEGRQQRDALVVEPLAAGLRDGRARGKWLDYQGIPLLPTFHPNYLLHNPSATAKRTAWEDFLLVMERAGLPISDKQRAYFLPK